MKAYSILTPVLILMLVSLKLNAQDPGRHQRAGYDPERMADCLDLTSEQQESIQAIHEEFLEAREQVWDNSGLTAEARRNRMHEIHKEKDEKIMEVLTEEQRQQFRSNRSSRPPGLFSREGFRGGFHELVLEKRRDFDQRLNDSEKKIIQDMRNELQAHRELMRGREPGECRDARAERDGQRDMIREKLQALDPVIENHKDELKAIAQEIRQSAGDREVRPGRNHARPGRENPGNEEYIRELHFLLLDPTIDQSGEGNSPEAVKLYPNPAKDQLNVEFEVDMEGMVTVELLDKGGNKLRELDAAHRHEGSHQILLNVENLHSGDLYYIRIVRPGKTSVSKFVKL